MNIVISAVGVVTPLGAGREPFAAALRQGVSALKPSSREAGVQAAEIDVPLKSLVSRKGLAPLSRAALLAAAGMENLLVEQAGLLPGGNPEECALVAGTAYGHVESKAEFHRVAERDGVRLVSPILFPNTIINSLSGHAAILFGLTGPNSTVTSGRRSGLEAVLRAASLIRAGRAKRAIVLGCDEVSPTLLKALRAQGAAGGIGPGEASVVLHLEEAASAQAAGRRALGRLLGAAERTTVGSSLRDALLGALRRSLEEAGVEAGALSWAALSRSGRADLDGAESEALAALLGGRKLPAAALKATFGETFGAGALLGCAAVLVAGAQGFVPATPPPWGNGDEDGGLVSLSAAPRAAPPGPVLVLALDEEGATCAVLEAMEARKGLESTGLKS